MNGGNQSCLKPRVVLMDDGEDLLVHLDSSGSLIFEYTALEDWYEARKGKKEPTVLLKVSQDISY